MLKSKLLLLVSLCIAMSYASAASAAMTLKKIGDHPFCRPPLTSEADLRALVKSQSGDVKIGFAKAGVPELYPAFEEQFPTAKVEPIKVAPGEKLKWMMFRKKGKGPVIITRDVTWGGRAPFDAYRFSIVYNEQNYEFVVPYKCGNFSLRSVTPAPKPVVVQPPVIPPKVEPPPPVAKKKGGFLIDAGIAQQFDPATYGFGRVGYEYLFNDKFSVMGLVGGFARINHSNKHPSEDAFVADVIFEYRLTKRFFVGLGGGFWSGDDGQFDVIADLGFRLSEDDTTALGRTALFFEARSAIDEFDCMRDEGRFGLGVRYRF
jgi:hypothetical protein